MRLWARITAGYPIPFLLLIVLITAALGSGFRFLRFDTSPNAVFASSDQSSQRLAELHRVFGPDDNDLLLMIEGDELLSHESLAHLRSLRDDLRQVHGVAGVASVFDLRLGGQTMLPLIPVNIPEERSSEDIRHDLVSHPTAKDQLISSDGKLMVFWVLLSGADLSQSEIVNSMEPIEEEIVGFENASGLRVWKTGHPAIREGVLTTIQDSLFYGTSFAVIAGATASLLLFRGFAPVGVCLLGPTLGAVWTFGLMGWFGVAVGGLTSSLPSLIFVIGLTDAVHLLLAANRQLDAGRGRVRAIYTSLQRVGPACLLTSLTTIIGFGSLLLSRLDAVAEFGVWAAIGAASALLADLCVLPLAVRFFNTTTLRKSQGSLPWMEALMQRVAQLPIRLPIRVSLLGIAVFFALLPIAMKQTADIRWTEAIPENTETNRAMALADTKFGGALPMMVTVKWPSDDSFPSSKINIVTGKIHTAIKQTDGFAAPASIYNTLAGLPGRTWSEKYELVEGRGGAVDRILNAEENQLLVTTRVPNDGALALERRLNRLNAKLDKIAEEHQDFKIDVTGTVVAASQNMRAVIGDLARSLSIASILIFAAMTIQFRSLLIGLLSFVPNMLPLLITAAGLSLFGFPLQITSALTFSLCLGLAVDDTIHVITHFGQSRKRRLSIDEAIRNTMLRVGPALLLTTGILVAGFGSMMLNPMPAIKLFSALCCVTMIAALIGDLILLPALLVVGYRK